MFTNIHYELETQYEGAYELNMMQFTFSAVIKMEGGTDHDLRILELTSEEEEQRSALAGGEPLKRENVKSADGDRKPLLEKDKNEKVGLVFLCHLPSASEIWECLVGNKTCAVPQEEDSSTVTQRGAAMEGDKTKEEGQKEGTKDGMSALKKVSSCFHLE